MCKVNILALVAVFLAGCDSDSQTQTQKKTQAEMIDKNAVTYVENDMNESVFISNIDVTIPTENINTVRFTVKTKANGFADDLSAQYSLDRLVHNNDTLKLPLWGMYQDHRNEVEIEFTFNDQSKLTQFLTVETEPYQDTKFGRYDNLTVTSPASKKSSYSYFYLENGSYFAPVIMDIDGNLRWVISDYADAYSATVTLSVDGDKFISGQQDKLVHYDFSGDGVEYPLIAPGLTSIKPHHEITHGKFGYLVNVDATKNNQRHIESILLEVDEFGNTIDEWDMGEIISQVMLEGGDDPSLLVRTGVDWFHMNSAIYDASDDSIIVSGRELFIVKIDYSTKKIKWILGDETKYWATFPSLLALSLATSDVKPMGEHALSIVDGELMFFNNGEISYNQPAGSPVGDRLSSSLVMKWNINSDLMTAVNTWNYDGGIWSNICSSVYQKNNAYLVTYSAVDSNSVLIRGLDSDLNTSIELKFDGNCSTWNSNFIELENVQIY